MWIVTAKYLEMIAETSVVSLRHRHHRKIICKVVRISQDENSENSVIEQGMEVVSRLLYV